MRIDLAAVCRPRRPTLVGPLPKFHFRGGKGGDTNRPTGRRRPPRCDPRRKNMRLHLGPQRSIRAHKSAQREALVVVMSGHAEITRRTFFSSNRACYMFLSIMRIPLQK